MIIPTLLIVIGVSAMLVSFLHWRKHNISLPPLVYIGLFAFLGGIAMLVTGTG